MGDTGLEHPQFFSGKTHNRDLGAAESGASRDDSGTGQAAGRDLAMVVDAWPNLPKVVQVGIVAMVQASSE